MRQTIHVNSSIFYLNIKHSKKKPPWRKEKLVCVSSDKSVPAILIDMPRNMTRIVPPTQHEEQLRFFSVWVQNVELISFSWVQFLLQCWPRGTKVYERSFMCLGGVKGAGRAKLKLSWEQETIRALVDFFVRVKLQILPANNKTRWLFTG